MSRPKKTLKLKELIDEVNRRNRESTCDPKVRQGWNDLLEGLLHRNDAYEGYVFLGPDKVPSDQDPGVFQDETAPMKYHVRDDSRRHYIVHPKLRENESRDQAATV